ncbi:MAG: hypothetical protein R3272_11350 [Candidatus Promineifilaceae bacterium]|nr:hypothetical protein [Candidatus Promineifilaceae bacterium]
MANERQYPLAPLYRQLRPAEARLLPIAALLLFAALLIAGCGGEVGAGDPIVVERVEGQVEWREMTGSAWTPVQEGQQLDPASVLRTGADGRLRLAFRDLATAGGFSRDPLAVITLAPGAELSIVALERDEAGHLQAVMLEQFAGRARHVVHAREDGVAPLAYSVTSAHGRATTAGATFTFSNDAVAATDGASFDASSVKGAHATRVAVDSGLVYGTAAGVTYPVGAGRVLFLRVDQPPERALFPLYGAGRLARNGPSWTIGERDFLLQEWTIVDGGRPDEAAIPDGAYVYVEGHLNEQGDAVADKITTAAGGDGLSIPDDGDGDNDLFADAPVPDASCIAQTGVIDVWDGATLILADGVSSERGTSLAEADLDRIEGEIARYSVVLLATCGVADEATRSLVILQAPPAQLALNEPVELCHVPSGDPAEQKTVTVAPPEVAKHVAHGDYLGACDPTLGDDAYALERGK